MKYDDTEQFEGFLRSYLQRLAAVVFAGIEPKKYRELLELVNTDTRNDTGHIFPI